MLLSTRNSLAAQESLLTTVRASILLVDHTYSGLGEALKTQMSNLRVFPMSVEKNGHDTMAQPSLETLGKSRSSIDLDTIIIYAHTSGSQGGYSHIYIDFINHTFSYRTSKARTYDASTVLQADEASIGLPICRDYSIYSHPFISC